MMIKINESPISHYEYTTDKDRIDLNELMREIENIPDEQCIVHVNGNCYRLASAETRKSFVLGIDLAFGLLQ